MLLETNLSKASSWLECHHLIVETKLMREGVWSLSETELGTRSGNGWRWNDRAGEAEGKSGGQRKGKEREKQKGRREEMWSVEKRRDYNRETQNKNHLSSP